MSTAPRRATAQERRPDAWEWRRQRTWELHEQGWWQQDIAAALGVSGAAVCQWLRRRREGGALALRTRPQPGPNPRVTAEQRAQLPGRLAQGAAAFGFRGAVWTTRRVAEVIWRTFGVRYHPD
jgi:transposase